MSGADDLKCSCSSVTDSCPWGRWDQCRAMDLHWLPLLGHCLAWGCCSLSWKGLQGALSELRAATVALEMSVSATRCPRASMGCSRAETGGQGGPGACFLSWEFPCFTRHYEEVNLLKSSPRREVREALISVCAGQFMEPLASAIY